MVITMGNTERIFGIMKYLCRVRHATMPALAEKFGVSTRTIKRDIDELGYLIPLETKTGRYEGGVYVMEGYSWNRAYMSKEEVDVLMSIRDIGEKKGGLLLDEKSMEQLKKMISVYSSISAK